MSLGSKKFGPSKLLLRPNLRQGQPVKDCQQFPRIAQSCQKLGSLHIDRMTWSHKRAISIWTVCIRDAFQLTKPRFSLGAPLQKLIGRLSKPKKVNIEQVGITNILEETGSKHSLLFGLDGFCVASNSSLLFIQRRGKVVYQKDEFYTIGRYEERNRDW